MYGKTEDPRQRLDELKADLLSSVGTTKETLANSLEISGAISSKMEGQSEQLKSIRGVTTDVDYTIQNTAKQVSGYKSVTGKLKGFFMRPSKRSHSSVDQKREKKDIKRETALEKSAEKEANKESQLNLQSFAPSYKKKSEMTELESEMLTFNKTLDSELDDVGSIVNQLKNRALNINRMADSQSEIVSDIADMMSTNRDNLAATQKTFETRVGKRR